MPQRIQRKRTKGWRMPEGAVNVTRPTIWGNPFIHATDVAKAVTAYEQLISPVDHMFDMGPNKLQYAKNAHRYTLHWQFPEFFAEHISQLSGKDLACWCPLDKPCHADVLLRLANPKT